MKGHLLNLLTELPHILDKPAKPACDDLLKHILFSKRENGFSGSDLRVAFIETYKLLFHQNVPLDVKILLSTAVKVSEILYSGDDKATPKSILQLHNCMWVHHELCKDLFVKLHIKNCLVPICIPYLLMHLGNMKLFVSVQSTPKIKSVCFNRQRKQLLILRTDDLKT